MKTCDFVVTIRQPEGPPVAELVSFQFPIERNQASMFLIQKFGPDRVDRVYSVKRPSGRFHHGFGWSDTCKAREGTR